MEQIGETLTVEAPADVLWTFLLRSVEAPDTFSTDVQGAESFARVDGTHGRIVTTVLGKRTERMEIDDARRELTFEMIDGTPCEGRVFARVFDNPGIGNMLSFLEYAAQFEPRGRGGEAMVAATLDEVREIMSAVKAGAEATPR